MIETMLMTSSSSGINSMSPIIVGSVGFTTSVPKTTATAKSYHIQQNQQIFHHQQNQESTNGFIGKQRRDTSSFMTTNNSIIIRNGSSSNSNMPGAVDNGKNHIRGSTTPTSSIDNNNDTTSSNGTCSVILPSMTINSQSKTPYSDATQVSIFVWRSDKEYNVMSINHLSTLF